MRFDIDDATSIDSAEMTPVMEKMEPSLPSDRPNFCLKKNVTHDLFTRRERGLR